MMVGVGEKMCVYESVSDSAFTFFNRQNKDGVSCTPRFSYSLTKDLLGVNLVLFIGQSTYLVLYKPSEVPFCTSAPRKVDPFVPLWFFTNPLRSLPVPLHLVK
jgi:hypothetical protein